MEQSTHVDSATCIFILFLAKVSERKNAILLNPFYSKIFIRIKQFHFDLMRSPTKDSYPHESEVDLWIPIQFNPF